MMINKVMYGDTPLLDLTGDDVEPFHVLKDKKFHGRDGVQRSGSFSLDSELIEQDELIQLIKDALTGKVVVNDLPESTPPKLYTVPTSNRTFNANGSFRISLPDSTYEGFNAPIDVNVNVPIPTFQTYYTGSGAPSSSLGNDGDLYLEV